MFAKKYTEKIDKSKWFVIAIWVIILIGVGFMFGPRLTDSTQIEFSASEDYESAKAQEIIEKNFAEFVDSTNYVIVMQREDKSTVLGNDTRMFSFGVADALENGINSRAVSEIFGYYLFENTSLDSLKYQMISEDLTATFITIDIEGSDIEDDIDMVELLRDEIEAILDDVGATNLNAYLLGFPSLVVDGNEGIKADMERIDAIVLPMSVVLLMVLLRSVRLTLLSLGSFGISLIISFGILERSIELADVIILSFVPAVLLSLTLGIAVDYSLFTLARFREERLKGRGVKESVETMMANAGHNILVSGLTLAVTTAGLILFPMALLSSVGIALTVGVLVTLAVNLTLIPAILLVAGGWFYATPKPKSKSKRTAKSKKPKASYWHTIGEVATTRGLIIIVVILLLALPVSIQVLGLEYGASTSMQSPRNTETYEGFAVLEESFHPGVLSPMTIVMESESGVMTPEFFQDQQMLASAIGSELGLPPNLIRGIAWLNGTAIPYQMAMVAYGAPDPSVLPLDLQLYLRFTSHLISDDKMYTYMEVILDTDPWGNEGREFVLDVRTIAGDLNLDATKAVYVGGSTANMEDLIDEAYSLFPFVIIVVIISVYVLIGALFKSLVLPLRLLGTVALTLSFIYGAVNLVFVHGGLLEGIFPALKDSDSVFYLLPIMSFPIIVGLGLDYDIFTVERIKEYTWKGYSNKEAIKHALEKTGRLITGAGLVMTFAFGGLMASSSMILIQFGFVLAFAIIIDTFVVRTLLVPSIMSFAEKLNWWPSKPPMPALSKSVSPPDKHVAAEET